MPAARTRTSTSPGPGDGMGTSRSSSGRPVSTRRIAFMRLVLANLRNIEDDNESEVGRAKENRVNGQGADRPTVAVVAQTVEADVVGRAVRAWAVEQLRVATVPVVVAALGLTRADFGQLGLGIHGLIGTGAKEDLR